MTAAILLLLFLTVPENAFAYLDPGSGSLLLQLLAAGILGALYAVKTSWRSVIAWLRRVEPEKIGETSPEDEEEKRS